MKTITAQQIRHLCEQGIPIFGILSRYYTSLDGFEVSVNDIMLRMNGTFEIKPSVSMELVDKLLSTGEYAEIYKSIKL